MLNALIEVSPTGDLIPKLVRGLTAHRTAGHWLSTQESGFVLEALSGYFLSIRKERSEFYGSGVDGGKTWSGNIVSKVEQRIGYRCSCRSNRRRKRPEPT